MRVFIFSIAVLSAMVAAEAFAQQNLIVNGGFDAGAVPLGWSVSGASVAMDDYQGDIRSSDGDGWYAKMGVGSAAPDGIFYQQVSVDPNSLYAFSFDYRLQGYYDEMIQVDIFDGAVDGSNITANPISSGDLYSSSVPVLHNAAYTKKGDTFTPTQSTVTFRLSDIGSPLSANAGVWADNVVIAPTIFPQSGEAVTLDAVADAEIDQHVNYNNAPLGKVNSMRIEIRDPAYQNPVESPQSWGLLKWDFSSIDPSAVIENASLRMIQCDGAVESVEVYAVDTGDWDELTVTWNNWVGTETLEYLGTMTDISYHDGEGVTTFYSSELTDWVQDWIDGDQENYGILLKWAGAVSEGDTFATREHETLDAPQLIINGNVDPYLPGDANRDRVVDEADAAILAANWLSEGKYWAQGDFSGDGVVNEADATMMAANWQGGGTASVPEPSILVLFAAGVLVFMARENGVNCSVENF